MKRSTLRSESFVHSCHQPKSVLTNDTTRQDKEKNKTHKERAADRQDTHRINSQHTHIAAKAQTPKLGHTYLHPINPVKFDNLNFFSCSLVFCSFGVAKGT